MKKLEKMTKPSGKQADLHASYHEIISVLGEPEGPSSDGKVRASWIVELDNGGEIMVHDYRDHHVPLSGLRWWSVNSPKSADAQLFLSQFNAKLRHTEVFGA